MQRIGLFFFFFLTLATLSASLGAADSKNIIDLQPWRKSVSIKIKDIQGKEGSVTLVNLNPNVNRWYLLQLTKPDGAQDEAYHLENDDPHNQSISLDQGNPYGIILSHGKTRSNCDLWENGPSYALKIARDSRVPYAPLCNGKIFLRNPTKGHRTAIEAVTDFLRNEIPGGDQIVGFIRDMFFVHLYEHKAAQTAESTTIEGPSPRNMDKIPAPALIDPKLADRFVYPKDLGIEIQGLTRNGIAPGQWFPAKGNPGIYVSVIIPNLISPEVMNSYKNVLNTLDSTELAQQVFLVAFDLDTFDVKYELGTDHPGLGWSAHTQDQMRDKNLPGPDGINTIAPLVRTGLVNPRDAVRTVATFTGGFKRHHGAFKYGEFALKNHGTHYGFLENGVVCSTLQPGLSTLYSLNDGSTVMKTWTGEDNALLPRIGYARQNGVPLIASFDQSTGISVPGALVAKWGPGNWSGSADERLRTMRSGAAIQETKGKRYLIYAFFWSSTPSAMTRVFQAYRVRYAMLLDMNALEHTYLAVYRRDGAKLYVQHLIQGMSGFDMSVKDQYIPRFLGYADDRDFFYLTRKEAP